MADKKDSPSALKNFRNLGKRRRRGSCGQIRRIIVTGYRKPLYVRFSRPAIGLSLVSCRVGSIGLCKRRAFTSPTARSLWPKKCIERIFSIRPCQWLMPCPGCSERTLEMSRSPLRSEFLFHPAGNWYLAGRVVATAGESMASKVDFFSGYKL